MSAMYAGEWGIIASRMVSRSTFATLCGLGVLCAAPADAFAQTVSIIPRPESVATAEGEFQLNQLTMIEFEDGDAEVRAVAEHLALTLRGATGLAVKTTTGPKVEHAVPMHSILLVNPGDVMVYDIRALGSDEALGREGYELTVGPDSVSLKAAHASGLFYGVQTLRQLLALRPAPGNAAAPSAGWAIPVGHVLDRPRLRWRGMLLDCGRHFMPKEVIKRYINLLAYHKLNVLHWHLTEDQGWRIEVKKYPRLTEVGAWRKVTRDSEQPRQDGSAGASPARYGGFYTQDDVREIVAYAKSRYVTVVPEIELPGHCQAALAAYPELSCTGGRFEVSTQWGVHEDVYCAGNDKVFEFLEGVLSEVIELFPSEYIHIGGDEVPKTRWKACPNCQARIKAEGLKDVYELQSWFIRRIEKFLNSKGRRLIGWDEILEGGLAPNATVQSWRGMDGAVAAAANGHDVISSPTSHCYLDYAQGRGVDEPHFMGFLPLERCYEFEPIPPQLSDEQARHVLGLEGNVWTEHAPPELVDRQAFPRLCALAEVAWSPKEGRDWDDFQRRLSVHYKRLDGLGVRYYVPPPQMARISSAAGGGQFELSTLTPLTGPAAFVEDALTVTFLPAFAGGEIRYALDSGEPTAASARFEQPLRIADSTIVRARTFLPNGNASPIAEQRFTRLAPHEPVSVDDAEPGLAYEYFEGIWGRLPAFDTFRPLAAGATEAIGPGVGAVRRGDAYALRFRGLFEAPADGIYTFHVSSDDGSRLLIGDTVVVDNDGAHPATERSGPVYLKTGRHALTIEFFELFGEQTLEVAVEGPGLPRQRMPSERLSISRAQREQAVARVPPAALKMPETVRPVPREPGPWMQRHEELCRRSRQAGVKLIFLGDSITQGWEGGGKDVWARYYAPRGAVNLGISGDRTQHVLWRLENGNLDGFPKDPSAAPKLAVVMIGTNNSTGNDHTADEIAQGIVAIVQTLHEKMPEAKVLLLAIFPRGEQPDPQREKIAEANRLASQRLADDKQVTYLDIGGRFLAPDGALPREIMPDFLHLSPRGYEIWAEAIEAKVQELLGERP